MIENTDVSDLSIVVPCYNEESVLDLTMLPSRHWIRKVVSICYNFLMIMLFPGIHTLDVNGNPKILTAKEMKQMELSSRDWFLEAEIMLKARYLDIPVIEIDVFGQLRQAGTSHVRFSTVVEFIQNMIRCRFGLLWPEWKKTNVKG